MSKQVPAVELFRLTKEGMKKFNISQYIGTRKVVVFALPGAFTPTCTDSHFKGFVASSQDLKAKGVEEVICLASNDAFVCNAFSAAQDPEGKITLFADGNNEFSGAMELTCDLSELGLGTRSKRYAMIVEGGTITTLLDDGGPHLEKSTASKVLENL